MPINSAARSMLQQAVLFIALTPAIGLASNDIAASGCSTGSTAISLSNSPSRLTGVAPLSVFFDASGTTAKTTKRPFHDLEYRWDFGDPLGSPVRGTTWKTGSRSGISNRNIATGPEAAHVFETPGEYIVALTVTDGRNTATNNCAIITVQDPGIVFSGTNTICVAAASMPEAGTDGCPAGAVTAMQPSFSIAVNTYAHTGKRVLFRRGDTFAAASSGLLTHTGPGILGAFGAGAAPVVQMTGNTRILVLSSRGTPDIRDWRIMDLEFDGQNKTECVGIDADGGISQVLILNMNLHDILIGVGFSDDILTAWYMGSGLTAHAMFDEIAIVDSTITPIFNGTSGWRIYASANRGSIQGNTLGNMINNNSMGSHVLRIPYMEKGVVANNTIARPGANQLAIKLHSQAWCESTSPVGKCVSYDNDAPPPAYTYRTNTHPIGVFAKLSGYTEKVVISDNRIIGADNPYTMSVASQNRQSDERLRDIIVERNWFQSGTGTQLSILVGASATTIRNNIFDMSAGKYKTFVNVSPPGTSPPSMNVHVYNNTFYGGSASPIPGNEFVAVSVDPTATDVAIVNNLISAPSATNPVAIFGKSPGLFSSNNSSAAQLKYLPGWISATPSTPSDFKLKAGSYAIGAGMSIPLFSDFFLNSRPPYNIGATGQSR
ncbi:MAG: PKD domain-containing protein [Nitrosomonadales bacterium]|nr:PKD domain-containing protein [Nitrosomonadales bacterium]